MNLLMIGGDTTIARGVRGPYWYTLHYLAQQWGRIDVLCNNVTNPVIDSNTPIHGNVYVHCNPTNRFFYAQWAKKYIATLQTQRTYALATCHMFPPFLQLHTGLFIQKNLGIPVVGEWHGVTKFTNALQITDTLGALLTRIYAKKSNQLTALRAVSTTVVQQLQTLGVQSKHVSLLPAVYIDPTIWNTQSTQKKVYDFVFCGRIDANKRLDRILRALALVPKATLLIIGDGPQKSTLESLAHTLGIAGRCTWLGWLQTPQLVAQNVTSARCLVMASGYEGGPRVVVEALAAGIPVIATRVGIVPDVLKEHSNGLYTIGTIQSLAMCMQSVLSNTSLANNAEQYAASIAHTYERIALLTTYNNWLVSASKLR